MQLCCWLLQGSCHIPVQSLGRILSNYLKLAGITFCISTGIDLAYYIV